MRRIAVSLRIKKQTKTMETNISQDSTPQNDSSLFRWIWLLAAVCGILILIGLFRTPRRAETAPLVASADVTNTNMGANPPGGERADWAPRRLTTAPVP